MKVIYLLIMLSLVFQNYAHANNCGKDDSMIVPSLLDTGFSNLSSFDYVSHAMKKIIKEPTTGCIVGWPLYKNEYQYYMFFYNFSLETREGTKNVSFLYQDASVQANHNLYQKAWTGLNFDKVRETFSNLVNVASSVVSYPTTKSLKSFVLGDFVGDGPFAEKANLNTLTLLPLKNITGTDEHLLVWFDSAFGINPYAVYPAGHAYLVRASTDGYSFHKLSLFTDLMVPLQKNLSDESVKVLDSNLDKTEYLINLLK